MLTKMQKEGLLKGKNHKAIISSIIYFISSSTGNLNVSFKDLERVTGLPETKIRKMYRYLVMSGSLSYRKPPANKPSKYVFQIISLTEASQWKGHLNLSLMAKFAEELGSFLHGKKPRGIAAAAVYILSSMLDFRIPQSAIAKKAGVSSLTLRRIVKEINHRLCITVEV